MMEEDGEQEGESIAIAIWKQSEVGRWVNARLNNDMVSRICDFCPTEVHRICVLLAPEFSSQFS